MCQLRVKSPPALVHTACGAIQNPQLTGPAMRHILRNGTVISRVPQGAIVRLPGGETIRSRPQDTPEYRLTAHELGYGDDTLGMCRDHDATHAWLADAIGLPDSPALRVSAGLDRDGPLARADEAATLSLQRFCRLAGVKLFVEAD